MKEMILASSQAKILLSQSDKTEIRQFLKNVGSNFILKDKKFNFALKIGWRALAEGEPMTSFPNWRRGWDLNPRDPCGPSGFRDRRTRPLCDLSLHGQCNEKRVKNQLSSRYFIGSKSFLIFLQRPAD